jgi:beta-1,4-mannosyl-glycoprotein beta-1,4-N-acetylglucosaminyltransferase
MKVYDCFIFYNEFELLELRLDLLNNMVDYFVLVEANKTHKNESKEYYFENNKDRFTEFLHKIIHIKVDDMPDFDPSSDEGRWKPEKHHRECILRGLQNIDPEDIVLISDVDEIPNPNIIEWLTSNQCKVLLKTRDKFQLDLIQVLKFLPESLFKNHGIRLLDRTPLALDQALFCYFVNRRSKNRWNGTVITKAKNLSTPQELRRRRDKLPRIVNCGWHFTYLGGVDRVLLKINALRETESNAYSADYIKECMSKLNSEKAELIDFADLSPEQLKTLVQKYPYLYFDYQIK